MALNMSDKKFLASQILPEVEFNITSIGITLSSSRLSTPRFVPYDQAGRCREWRVFNINGSFCDVKCCEENKDVKPPPPSALPTPTLKNQTTLKPQPPISQPTPLLSPPRSSPTPPPITPIAPPTPPPPPTAEEGILNEFFDQLSAATTAIPSQAQKLEALKEQAAEMEKEEMEAIASIQ
uniref:Classical arabinogalactan protein 9-like n=1 Tax=Meloidogyne hapla TaxID=6305 RepID=A0A1I8BSB4_MELHA